jgi:hypothetical protein
MKRLPGAIARVVVLGAVLGLLGCSEPSGDPPPWLALAGAESGLDFVYHSGHSAELWFPEIMGAGAALFDMDGDGDLDAYMLQGGEPLTAGRIGNRLYRNDGHGRFEDVTESSGAGDTGYAMGVTAGDFDNDGLTDLYVTNYGPNVLLRNDGAGRFSDVTRDAGVGDPAWGTSAAFLDFDADGDLDLFVANYVAWSVAIERNCYNVAGALDYCAPTAYAAPAASTLYENLGQGRFRDVSTESGITSVVGHALGVVCTDVDGDGRVDIFVANDATHNQLWMNRGDGRFVDEAMLRGCALDTHGALKAGMGVVAQDIDDDGDEDLLVVNLTGQTDSLFINQDGYFRDRTGRAGLTKTVRRFTRFGVGMPDLNNDGLAELFQANGDVYSSAESPAPDPFAQPNRLFRGVARGRFAPVVPADGTAEPLTFTSRGAAFGDVDGDGGIDILVVNRDASAHLLRNVVTHRGHWLRVRVVEASGRDALGAVVVVEFAGRRLTRVIRAAYGYCSSHDPAAHFGLGEADRVERVRVTWPDGFTREFAAPSVDRSVEFTR